MQVQSEVVLFQRSPTCSVLDSNYHLCHHINRECFSFHKKVLLGVHYFLFLSILAAPLAGWLADAKFGNYKVVRFGVWLLFVSAVFNCFYYLIVPFFGNTLVLRWFVFVIYVMFMIGGAGCSLALFQLGMDQMPDASSSSISSFITWFVCSGILGAYFGNFLIALLVFCLDISLHSNYQQIWSLLVVLSLSCVLISDFCLSKNWLIIEPKSPSSLKTIYQVLKFAAKHKTPLNRSALTYWEEDIPSRMDLGKSRYGGPFTTEQVEDVKTMFRIFLVGLSLMVIGLPISLHPGYFDVPSSLNIVLMRGEAYDSVCVCVCVCGV